MVITSTYHPDKSPYFTGFSTIYPEQLAPYLPHHELSKLITGINNVIERAQMSMNCSRVLYILLIIFFSMGWIASIPLTAVFLLPKSTGGFLACFFGLLAAQIIVVRYAGLRLYRQPGEFAALAKETIHTRCNEVSARYPAVRFTMLEMWAWMIEITMGAPAMLQPPAGAGYQPPQFQGGYPAGPAYGAGAGPGQHVIYVQPQQQQPQYQPQQYQPQPNYPPGYPAYTGPSAPAPGPAPDMSGGAPPAYGAVFPAQAPPAYDDAAAAAYMQQQQPSPQHQYPPHAPAVFDPVQKA